MLRHYVCFVVCIYGRRSSFFSLSCMWETKIWKRQKKNANTCVHSIKTISILCYKLIFIFPSTIQWTQSTNTLIVNVYDLHINEQRRKKSSTLQITHSHTYKTVQFCSSWWQNDNQKIYRLNQTERERGYNAPPYNSIKNTHKKTIQNCCFNILMKKRSAGIAIYWWFCCCN